MPVLVVVAYALGLVGVVWFVVDSSPHPVDRLVLVRLLACRMVGRRSP